MLFAPKEKITSQLNENYQRHLLGDSHGAALVAAAELERINHQRFTNSDAASLHGEWARQALVLGAAAVKKGEKPLQAVESLVNKESAGLQALKQDLLIALQTANDHYPLADTEEEARRRGDFWQPVYETQSAQIEALRDVFHLTLLLGKIFDDAAVKKLSGGLRELLFRIAKENPVESSALVFLTEEAPYDQAQKAYDNFVYWFGPQSEKYNSDRLMVVSARFLYRSLIQANFQQFQTCLNDLLAIHHRNKANSNLTQEQKTQELQKIQRQLLTNLTRPFQTAAVGHQYANLRARLTAGDQAIFMKIHQLTRANFVGLGHGKVVKIGEPLRLG
jgi:hypothetical protein